jgi:hypothetical protein
MNKFIINPMFIAIIKKTGQRLSKDRGGSALLMSILILAGFLLSTLTASELVLKGLNMGETQFNSTRAYFAAEAGAEQSLWEVRHDGYGLPATSTDAIFSGVLGNEAEYQVDYTASSTVIFNSIGRYKGVARNVEVEY